MIKKIFIFAMLSLLISPVFADELLYNSNINMTPSKSFSGFSDNSIRSTYPKLNTSPVTTMDQRRRELMKAKSITEMGNYTPKKDDVSPITFSQFPQKMDSSNMMHVQSIQNGMQNMYMGF